jgi:prophage maintenance system killer protein
MQIDVRLENETVWLSANQYALDTLDDYDYERLSIKETYPSVEEKAAMLLYLVTKNHSFSDGNKRIAATLFLWFMDNNGILFNPDGSKRIADNTLVALTLMIAESRTEEKDTMVKVVVNLINQNN